MGVNPATAFSILTEVSVAQALRPGVVTCPPDASVATLAATLVTHGTHAVVVSPSEHAPPLIVTDLEVVRAALDDSGHARAADIAREPMVTVDTDVSLSEAVAAMAVHYVTHLLAIDPGSHVPVGVVSSLDVAAVLGGCEPRLARLARPLPARPMVSARTLRQATIRTVMHPGVVTCSPQAPLTTVARIMAEHRVHCVAVAGIDTATGSGPHYAWGLIGDMDLMLALHLGAGPAAAVTIATTSPIAVEEDASLDQAAALMVEHDTSHVVVVGPSGLPSGMVSTLEVARILAASN